jgi:nucleoside triphosphate diphosphatase
MHEHISVFYREASSSVARREEDWRLCKNSLYRALPCRAPVNVGLREAMTPSKDISRLLEIMEALRTPVTGCPWDLEQTFRSISPYTIEEAYEVADAIERNDLDDLCEELGDLLLQVVFHAQMASEIGAFSFGDVVEKITTKMLRRHPHVFGDEKARSAGMAKGTWDNIKFEEKAQKAAQRAAKGIAAPIDKGFLDDVPVNLPALTRALKLQQRAANVGFDWDNAGPILNKLEEEVGELRAELATGNIERSKDEYGDLLFVLVNLGRHLKIDPEAALTASSAKFRRRFRHIEESLSANGKELEAVSLDEMETLWVEAKVKEKA